MNTNALSRFVKNVTGQGSAGPVRTMGPPARAARRNAPDFALKPRLVSKVGIKPRLPSRPNPISVADERTASKLVGSQFPGALSSAVVQKTASGIATVFALTPGAKIEAIKPDPMISLPFSLVRHLEGGFSHVELRAFATESSGSASLELAAPAGYAARVPAMLLRFTQQSDEGQSIAAPVTISFVAEARNDSLVQATFSDGTTTSSVAAVTSSISFRLTVAPTVSEPVELLVLFFTHPSTDVVQTAISAPLPEYALVATPANGLGVEAAARKINVTLSDLSVAGQLNCHAIGVFPGSTEYNNVYEFARMIDSKRGVA